MPEGLSELRIELLGPVEVRVDGRPVALGGQRPRALFAMLAIAAGHVVSHADLIDELWGDDPPARARDSLQMHVSRLRKALTAAGGDAGRLVSRGGGYALDMPVGGRDIDRWHDALADARRAREAGDPLVARAEIEAALGLWRGRPLGGVGDNGLLGAERGRLEEERIGAVIEGIELDLELGRHGELLGQLEALVTANPFNERLVELQMRALYRAGRQADALTAFHAARGRFVEELGIEPGAALSRLHEAVLGHSPGLAPPPVTVHDVAPEAGTASVPRAGARVLPAPPNRTVGRDRELRALAARLRVKSARLVTLTGPGGVGKTRLAVEVARAVAPDFADGACFVPLAAVERPEDIPSAVNDALGIVVLAGESYEQAAQRFLAAKHLLLVIDNVEHLLAGAPCIAALLETCPTLTILATSREPLALRAEELRPVTPLALPDPAAHPDTRALARVDAVALFCDRAAAHDPGFALDDGNAAAIAQICRRVDGLPLAIELAAARCGLLSPDELADRLDEALAAPGAGARDAAARQQTLRATIDWSHALLDEAAQAAFARFAPFAGGATIEAAEAITGADLGTLDGLVAKNLLVRRRHADEATRLRMLQTVRAYAADRLALAADGDAVRERHYRYFLALAERHGTEPALFGAGGSAHAARLDADIDNLNAALTWALRRPDAEPALALCAALGQYWWLRNRYADAANWIDRALSMPGADAHRALRVRALCSKAAALWPLGRRAELFAAITEAETIARQLADPLLLSHTLQSLARLVSADGPVGGGAAIADEALDLARAAGDDWAIGMAAFATTIAAPTLGEWRERLERAAALLDTAGNAYHLARLFAAGIGMALGYGSERDARALVERATPLVRALDDPQSWSFLLCNGGLTALLTGDTDAADDAFSQGLRLAREVVAPRFAQESLLGLAAVAAVREDTQRAAMLTGSAAAHRDDAPQNEIEARIDAEFLGPARARHGPDTWDAAVREGASLSLPDAIQYALHQREPVGPHTPLRG